MRRLILPAFVFALGAAAAAAALASGRPLGNACIVEGNAADPPTFRNCLACHDTAAMNSGDGSFRLDGVPAVWTPGAVYRITANLADPGQSRWGFRIAALHEDFSDAGLLASADGNAEPCVLDGRFYLRHSPQGARAGVPDGPVDFAIDWTAPAAGGGTVRFYATGVAADNGNDEPGDFVYTDACAAVEDAPGAPQFTLTLQPDEPVAGGGADWTVRARIRNHGLTAQMVRAASRVRLPNGKLVPPTGFLQQPVPVSLAPGAQADAVFLHSVPAGVPSLIAEYQGFVGVAPATLLARDLFSFRLQP